MFRKYFSGIRSVCDIKFSRHRNFSPAGNPMRSEKRRISKNREFRHRTFLILLPFIDRFSDQDSCHQSDTLMARKTRFSIIFQLCEHRAFLHVLGFPIPPLTLSGTVHGHLAFRTFWHFPRKKAAPTNFIKIFLIHHGGVERRAGSEKSGLFSISRTRATVRRRRKHGRLKIQNIFSFSTKR